ncbi:dynein axonemal heavy chain 7-like [Phyllobates terribilis]|uniref:dynein axonemal heavy chain 7-like n=1 Tax=Phyllobates terribilis TaxID=111132 RepID=UPI003CCAA8B7
MEGSQRDILDWRSSARSCTVGDGPPCKDAARLEIVPKPWKKSFLTNYNFIKENLNSMNPTMAAVLDLWHSSFMQLRLVDTDEFHNRQESMELSIFQNLPMRHIDSAKEKLLK